jgi:hypothetical protein
LERRNMLMVDDPFRETLELQNKDSTPLLHSLHFDDLKCGDIFGHFSAFSFKDLLFVFLSLIVNVRLLERHLRLQARKLADDSTVRYS